MDCVGVVGNYQNRFVIKVGVVCWRVVCYDFNVG